MIELKPVSEADGETDTVWFFTHGKAYEKAQKYFACYDDEEWDGLPLAG